MAVRFALQLADRTGALPGAQVRVVEVSGRLLAMARDEGHCGTLVVAARWPRRLDGTDVSPRPQPNDLELRAASGNRRWHWETAMRMKPGFREVAFCHSSGRRCLLAGRDRLSFSKRESSIEFMRSKPNTTDAGSGTHNLCLLPGLRCEAVMLMGDDVPAHLTQNRPVGGQSRRVWTTAGARRWKGTPCDAWIYERRPAVCRDYELAAATALRNDRAHPFVEG